MISESSSVRVAPQTPKNMQIRDHLRRASLEIAARVQGGAGPGIFFLRLRWTAHECGKLLAEQLGEPVLIVTGDTSVAEREAAAAALRGGQARLAVATSVWTDGINIPGLRWIALVDGEAPIGVVQAAGRASRRADNKDTFEVWNFSGKGAERRRARLLEEGLEDGGCAERAPLPPAARKEPEEVHLPGWQKAILLMLLLVCIVRALQTCQ